MTLFDELVCDSNAAEKMTELFTCDSKPPVTISVLTWKAPKTLSRTLASLAPLYSFFAGHYVVCAEGDQEEIAIAQSFGFTPIPTKHNLGIQEGLALCAEVSQTELVLVMECDCKLEYSQNLPALLSECCRLITEENFKAIQLQRRPDTPSQSYRKYWKNGFPIKPTIWGRIRRAAAMAKLNECIALPNFPQNGIPFIAPRGNGIFSTTSNTVNWCNRSFLTTKTFFLGELVKFAREHPTSRKVNGLPDLEHPINCRQNRAWWRGEKFRLGLVYPGLFSHHRLERPPEDEKKEL
jgi:hypothetical protein